MNRIKREQLITCFIILGSIILNLPHIPPNELFFDDKEIFRYIGMVVARGGVPYRDVFDHKPPLIYFFDALAYISPWICWVADTLLVAFATWVFYGLCKRKNLSAAWFLPLIFNLMLRYSIVSFGDGMTREYTALFLLLFFCTSQSDFKGKYSVLGLLTGLSFWMQQDSFITLLPLLLYVITQKDHSRGFWQRAAILLLGFCCISLMVILYFAGHHAMTDLWRDAFVFNFQGPGSPVSLARKFINIKHALHETEFEMAFYTSLVIGCTALAGKSGNPKLLLAGILTLGSSFSAEMLTGRLSNGMSFAYYLLPLAASVPMVLYIVFTESEEPFFRNRQAQFVLACMTSLILMMGTVRYALTVHPPQNTSPVSGLIITYLDSQRLKDYQLYVFNNSNLIALYNKYRILCPSRSLYQFFWDWTLPWNSGKSPFPDLVRDLNLHHTVFILDQAADAKTTENAAGLDAWEQFLQEHYQLIQSDFSGTKLWRRQ